MASLKPRKESPKLKEEADSETPSAASNSGSESAALMNIDLGDLLTRRKTFASEKGYIIDVDRKDKASVVSCVLSFADFRSIIHVAG